MKATYNPTAKTKFNRNHRKENPCYFQELSIIDPTPKENDYSPHLARSPIVARIYGTGSRNYCCLWVNNEPIHTSGSDYAGGYGYHRSSAALQGAIDNAGFTLDKRIDGVGDSAMEEAMLAIAECIGIKNPLLHRSHA
jgi:hypothetical protein